MPSHEKTIRVLVVDDAPFMRDAISRVLREAVGIELAGTARDGLEAIDQAEKLQPDVITLDFEMPVMDGLTAIKRLRRACGAAVLMVSNPTAESSHDTLRALQLGASDFIATDRSRNHGMMIELESQLIEKVRAIAPDRQGGHDTGHAIPAAPSWPSSDAHRFDLVVVGASTGGPTALESLLTPLPAGWPLPIVIAQHMPGEFTPTMAERLDNLCAVDVIHGESGMLIEPGRTYVMPGGQNMSIESVGASTRLRLRESNKPADWPFKPSVNELFGSAARACRGRALGVVLTGISEDGLAGSRELCAAGGAVLAQDRASSVVYEMPKAVTRAGLTSTSLDPRSLALCLCQLGQPALPLPPRLSESA